MPPHVAGTRIVLNPMPTAHFGAAAVAAVAGIVRGAGCETAVIVTDQGLARTAVVASVADALAASGIPVTVFSEVHANPTAGDVAAGADAVPALAAGNGRPAVVAVGGGSPICPTSGSPPRISVSSPPTLSMMRPWPARRARRQGPTSGPSSPVHSTAPAVAWPFPAVGNAPPSPAAASARGTRRGLGRHPAQGAGAGQARV